MVLMKPKALILQRRVLRIFYVYGLIIIVAIGLLNMQGQTTIRTMAEVNLTEVRYQEDGIDARYPQFTPDHDQSAMWNKIIKADFDKILGIYSFRPITGLSPSPGAGAPTILKILYEIKLDNARYTGIFYTADFMSPYSAHPTQLIYTTNLDKENDVRLRLSDIVTLNRDFIQNFRSWEPVSDQNSRPEIIQGIRDYIAGLNDEELLMGMKSADLIGSGNLYDIYSYLTPDKLGISIGIPNFLGDHAEFEQEYAKLKDYLKKNISEYSDN